MAKGEKADYDDGLVYEVSHLYFEKNLSVKEISEELEKRHPEYKSHKWREKCYPILKTAFKRKFLRLNPPIEESLSREIKAQLNELKVDLGMRKIRVVNSSNELENDRVPLAAAHRAMEILKEIAREKIGSVSLGLGPGRATNHFSRHLGELMENSAEIPKVNLIAISAGCIAEKPDYAPSNFFNFFPNTLVERQIGMFGANLVRSEEYEDTIKMPGLREAFDKKESVDICVTAMGYFHDPHDLYTLYLNGLRELPAWKGVDCVPGDAIGNVQYRPYSEQGPIHEDPSQPRAITLFELDDFVKLSTQVGKHVVLMVRQCRACQQAGDAPSRARAVLPLLANPALHVWNTMVIDRTTAQEILGMLKRQNQSHTV